MKIYRRKEIFFQKKNGHTRYEFKIKSVGQVRVYAFFDYNNTMPFS